MCPSPQPAKENTPGLSPGQQTPVKKNNKARTQSVDPNTSEPPINSSPDERNDAYLLMDISQLRRKVKDLISLKNKNEITINDLKRERADLQKAKSALEKEFKKDAAKRDRELRNLSESHNNQISTINDLHAKNIAKKML